MPAQSTHLHKQFSPALLALAVVAAPAYAEQVDSGEVVELNEVVVTAAGYEQQLIDAPASITVITQEDLEGKYYRDVTDALQDIPGVSIEGGAGGKGEEMVGLKGRSGWGPGVGSVGGWEPLAC